MKEVTGKDVCSAMLDLFGILSRWNRRNTSLAPICQQCAALGLTPHQIELLGFLHTNPTVNTVSALSQDLFISKGSLSLMLTKLQLGGYVKKEAARDDDDGRKVYISLTEKGADAVQTMVDTLVGSVAGSYDNMDAEKRALLYQKVEEIKTLFTGGNE